MNSDWPGLSSRLSAIAKAAHEKKAVDILILDVSKISSVADCYFICSGQNVRQTQTIAEEIEANLASLKAKPLHTEGKSSGNWILMDCEDILIHIFMPEARDFFDLESLWGDAPKVSMNQLVSNKANEQNESPD